MKFSISRKFIIMLFAAFILQGCGKGAQMGKIQNSNGASGVSSGPLSYNGQIKNIVQTRCASCHGPGSPFGNWTDYTTVSQKLKEFKLHIVDKPDMPKGNPGAMPESERNIIAQWLAQGAPENGPASAPTSGNTGSGTGTNPAPTPEPPPVVINPPSTDLLSKCMGCHTLDGNSITPMFPVLAGQSYDYLVTELQAFRSKERNDPMAISIMQGMAQNLTDDEIRSLAKYFSEKKTNANPNSFDKNLAATGKNYFENGIPAKNVMACATCHGPNGMGVGSFPRLASQHLDYLNEQYEAFKAKTRGEARTMPGQIQNLSKDEMNAISNYLQSIHD